MNRSYLSAGFVRLLVTCIVCSGTWAGLYAATFPVVVVQDKFTTTNGANVNGRTPQDANLTGDVWHIYGSNAGAIIATDSGRQVASFGGDEGQRISLSAISSNILQVEGTLRFANNTFTTAYRSAGIGFTTSGSPVNATGFFTGLGLGPTSGTDNTMALKLFTNSGISGNGGPASQITITGQLASAYHDLAYTINRTTGAISDITLDGTSYSFSTSAFTTTNTAYFAMYSSSASGGLGNSFFDSATLSLPEPMTASILAIPALLVCRRRNAR